MDIVEELESLLKSQSFEKTSKTEQELTEFLLIVKTYATVEHAVAVLSDLANNKSYICVGSFGQYLGLNNQSDTQTAIDSIWEEEIYSRIHPDDLFDRHLLELKFFHFLRNLKPAERTKYATSSRIRALDAKLEYHYISHRTLYLGDCTNNSLRLALCLYNFSVDQTPQLGINGKIINNETGETISVSSYNNCSNLLTSREKQVLQCVSQGLLSKEISEKLNISLNTVNRHRQNILQKLDMNNSIEAVKTAAAMNLIE